MERLFGLLQELAWHVRDPDPVRAQLQRLRTTVAGSDFDDVERSQLEQAARRVEQAIVQCAGRGV